MLRAILIDNEVTALVSLEKYIGEFSEITIIGKYTDQNEAYEAIVSECPDVLFTEIKLPKIDGMTLAKKVLNLYPETKIVFVTTETKYAVEAFEIGAFDFIRKPAYKERLIKTLKRLKEKHHRTSNNNPVICCFKTLKFKRALDHKHIDVNWRTTKARELFAFLIHNRFETVRKDVIIDTLWPEYDLKNASSQLYSTIYQIRKTMDYINFPIEIISTNNHYNIKMNGVKTDVDIMEEGLKNFDLCSKRNIKYYKQLLKLYKGDYLEEDNYHWALCEQNRLKVLWVVYLTELADYYIDRKKYADAIMLYLHYQSISPYNEDIYFKLMWLYDKVGNRKSIEILYYMLKDMLKKQFDDVPSKEVKQWYKSRIKKLTLS